MNSRTQPKKIVTATSAKESKDFAMAVENEFLPVIIKPGRYVSAEWVCPQADVTEPADSATLPTAVVIGLKSYERAVNDPLVAATRLALHDCLRFQVGMTYPLGEEALGLLQQLNLTQFSAPGFLPIQQAAYLIAPLSAWSDLIALSQVLQTAGIPLARSDRKPGSPELIAVTDGMAIPSLAYEIFDSLTDLQRFLSDPSGSVQDAGAARVSGSVSEKVSEKISQKTTAPADALLPFRPVTPTVEVARHKARFRFNSGLTLGGSEIGASVVKAVKQSGLIEIELEGCANLCDRANLGDIINSLAQSIDSRRYALSIRDVAPAQVSERLVGALARFRRVRIEIATLSLSPTACAACGSAFDAQSLAVCFSRLRFDTLQSAHLAVQLGFGIDPALEAEETVETLQKTLQKTSQKTSQAGAGVLSPRCGLRVRFSHRVATSAILSETRLQQLFETIKHRRKLKGVTYALEDSYMKLFAGLVERDGFAGVSELETFIQETKQRPENPAERENIWNGYREAFDKAISTGADGTIEKSEPKESPQCAEDSSVSTAAIAPAARASAFGRRKKRMVVNTVAAPTRTRMRFTWAVSGPSRFLSHLDNIRAIEAALLRSGLALSYTQGQRPRLKVSFGPPKPVGFTSECEQFDAYFETAPTATDIARLDPLLPPGFSILSARQSLTSELSILEATRSATYVVGIEHIEHPDIESALTNALSQNKLVYTRQSKKRERQIDVRPGVFAAELLSETDPDYVSFCKAASLSGETLQVMRLTLALTDTFSVRPEEFLSVSGIAPRERAVYARIHRLRFGSEILRPAPTKRAGSSEKQKTLNVSGA